MSLSKPHPMYEHAVTSYQVNKCVTVARLLSGRFRTRSLLRHFYPDKVSGLCELCFEEYEDIPHIILPKCTILKDKVATLYTFAQDTLSNCKAAAHIFENIVISGKDDNLKVQFLLDPSVIPQVITATQIDKCVLPELFKVTTTWCYSLVRTRRKHLEA